MQIAILGALEVRDDAGAPVEISGGRLRTLLTRLALDAGRPVPLSALVDAVWGKRPPADEANALQTLVSRLRRTLGSAAVVQSAAGYRLAVDPADVDAVAFERLAADGAAALHAGEHQRAVRLLREALGLWRGPALSDAGTAERAGDALATAVTRLTDRQLGARIDLAAAGLEAGAADVGELEELAAANPLNERVAGLLLRALGANGRQADALQAYERLRTQLADELGVDPSPELQQLHLALLRGELGRHEPPRTRRTNLKAQLTTFVGRDAEVARIGKSLEQNRLVTLVGPGGAGKTRLAGESAARVVDTAPDGVWLAELAAVTSGADIAQAVLGSVGLREIHLMERNAQPSARDALSRLCDGLADRHALLVLDNCEHLVDAAARLAEHLLGECPNLRILATSREPLGITGEVLLAVPPLGQPAATASAAEALEYPAVQLFADRAAAARAGFAVDDESVASVVEIVRRLDGLPLAIELAAARLRAMPVDEIAARLSDRFRLLTGGSRTALPRHRTLRAVVEWSWALLTHDERLLAEQLAVFPAGITVDSAAAVWTDGTPADVPDLLASLLDRSLLQPVGDGRRMRMLETIREYGSERLAERAELGAARERHARHFAAVLAEAEPHLTTAGQLPWFELLTDERENILAALRFWCDAGDADAALQIAVTLGGYAMMMGDHAEVTAWLRDALDVPGGRDRDLRLIARVIAALNSMGVGRAQSDADQFADLQSVAVALEDVDVLRTPMMAVLRPAAAFFAGDDERARRYIDDSIAGPDDWARATARMFLANLAENSGDVDTMRVETERALAEFRRLGERWGLASTLRNLAQIRTLDGDLDAAVAAYDEALSLMREMHSSDDEVMVYGRLADLALRQGDTDRARAHLESAAQSAEAIGANMESVFRLSALGDLERRLGNLGRARELADEASRALDVMPREHPVQGHVRTMVLGSCARLALDEGNLQQAQGQAREAYEAAVQTRDLPIIASVGVLSADLSTATGDIPLAVEKLGAAARLRGADDLTSPDVQASTRRARQAIGDDAFERAYEQGRALARDEAIARLRPA